MTTRAKRYIWGIQWGDYWLTEVDFGLDRIVWRDGGPGLRWKLSGALAVMGALRGRYEGLQIVEVDG